METTAAMDASPKTCYLLRLPNEILVEICEFAFRRGIGRDALSKTSRTCKRLQAVATPILYRAGGHKDQSLPSFLPLADIQLPRFPVLDIVGLLSTLDTNPDLAAQVKFIAIPSINEHTMSLTITREEINPKKWDHPNYDRLDTLASRVLNYDRGALAALMAAIIHAGKAKRLWRDLRQRAELTVIAMACLLRLTPNVAEAMLPLPLRAYAPSALKGMIRFLSPIVGRHPTINLPQLRYLHIQKSHTHLTDMGSPATPSSMIIEFTPRQDQNCSQDSSASASCAWDLGWASDVHLRPLAVQLTVAYITSLTLKRCIMRAGSGAYLKGLVLSCPRLRQIDIEQWVLESFGREPFPDIASWLAPAALTLEEMALRVSSGCKNLQGYIRTISGFPRLRKLLIDARLGLALNSRPKCMVELASDCPRLEELVVEKLCQGVLSELALMLILDHYTPAKEEAFSTLHELITALV